jgi:CYTH domain-containing protein
MGRKIDELSEDYPGLIVAEVELAKGAQAS